MTFDPTEAAHLIASARSIVEAVRPVLALLRPLATLETVLSLELAAVEHLPALRTQVQEVEEQLAALVAQQKRQEAIVKYAQLHRERLPWQTPADEGGGAS